MHLSPAEMLIAAIAGVMRQVENIKLARQEYYGAEVGGGDFQMHIEGALGEYAVAKHLGVHWAGKGKFRGIDVGPFQVRCSQGGRCLIVHEYDADEAIFYFVRWGGALDFEVGGPVMACEAKRPEFWRDDVPAPAFFYPMP